MTDNMYIIRYCLPPEPTRAQPARIELLERFCEEGKIDEVMFFLMPEEYNRGQWRREDYMSWLEFFVRAREIIENAGIEASLNPWQTLLHIDRGRRSEGIAFRRMVMDTGDKCLSVACPLCPDWRELFLTAFGDFARAGFKTIWVEDDFRFHNHGRIGWGGCFCDEHIRLLRERGIAAKDRRELIANINRAGQVHPDRIIWMDMMRETHLELAGELRPTMDEIDPTIKLGLMCSTIANHSVEARDWNKLIEAFGGIERVPLRPHAAPYFECCRDGCLNSMGNLSMSMDVMPKGTKKFFELENSPMSRFSKSQQQTSMQMAFAIEGGCDGLTLDVLDFLGNGSVSEPAMAATLSSDKPNLLKIKQLVCDTEPVGIRAILPPNTPRVAPGNGVADLKAIPNISYGWFTYLEALGYPCLNCSGVDKIDPTAIYALSGQSVWPMDDRLLEDMLTTTTVLIDPVAAEVILKRGLGHLIALDEVKWYCHNDHPFAFEQAVEIPDSGIPERAGLNKIDDRAGYQIAVFETTDQAIAKSRVCDCFLRPMGTGTYVHSNDSGGKVMVIPTPLPIPHRLFNWIRKAWTDRWLTELCSLVPFPILADSPWMYISARIGSDRRTIFLANTVFETYQELPIRLPPDWVGLDWTLGIHGRGCKGSVEVVDGSLMLVKTNIVGSDWLMVVGR